MWALSEVREKVYNFQKLPLDKSHFITEVHIMTEEHVVLSERPEDQLKAVEWAREQKKKILDDKSRRIADALMEKMTPLILKNSAQK